MDYQFRILENHLLVKRKMIKNCRSKKKRIIKKWFKNPKNYKAEPDTNYYVAGNLIFCHSSMAYRVREIMKESASPFFIPMGMV